MSDPAGKLASPFSDGPLWSLNFTFLLGAARLRPRQAPSSCRCVRCHLWRDTESSCGKAAPSMTDNEFKNKTVKSSQLTSVDYSVVDSLEIWELNNLKKKKKKPKNALALLYIYKHKYLHTRKEKSRFQKMRFAVH